MTTITLAPPTDFFKAGGTLHVDAPSYVARAADEELYRRLAAGHFCYVLTSRQMGKSSLMIRTAARLRRQDIHTAIVDLSGLGTQVTSSHWYLGLLTRLSSELKLTQNVEQWWQARGALSVVQRFTDFMHDVVLAQVTGRIVIFIDEIDSTLKLDFTDDFFAAIRTFYNARASDPVYERLTFVLLGVAAPADLIQNRNLTPFNIGHGIDLQELSRADAQPLQRGLEQAFPGQGALLLDRIFAWTYGHPYLTQKLCQAVVDGAGQGEPGIDALVQRLFLDKDAKNEDNLQFVRSNVEASKEKRRLLQLYRRIYTDKPVSEDERSLLHNRLKLIGLVHTVQGVLQVRNEIYRRVFDQVWIRENTSIEWTKIITIGAILVTLFSIGTLLYFQGVQKNERFAFNQSTFLDEQAAKSFRMSSFARMCELREQPARDVFFALPAEKQLVFFQAEEIVTIDWNLVTVARCLQPGLAALPSHHRQQLMDAIDHALHKRCKRKSIEAEEEECRLAHE
ncbi:MAG: AAA-like domain-containing protein [Caldilineaceae bacterium]